VKCAGREIAVSLFAFAFVRAQEAPTRSIWESVFTADQAKAPAGSVELSSRTKVLKQIRIEAERPAQK